MIILVVFSMMNLNSEESPTILIERGSFMTHCGYTGYDTTELSFRTPSIGIEAQFKHIFQDILNVDPTQHKVVIIKDAGTDQKELRKEANILFNKFQVKACAFTNAQRCIFYSTGSRGSNGLIIDLGYENTLIVPIVEYMTEEDFMSSFPYAGRAIEKYIIDHLIKNGIEETIIEENREQFFPYLMSDYFFFDSESEEDYERGAIENRKKNLPKFLTFQDKKGNKIKLLLPDPILPQSLIKEKSNLLNHSLSKEINKQLLRNLEYFGRDIFGSDFECHYDRWWVARIILTGGLTNILGLKSLILRELVEKTELKKFKGQNRSSSSKKVDIDFRGNFFTILNLPYNNPPHSWIGGSIEWSLKPFSEFFVLNKTYQKNPEMSFPIDYESPFSYLEKMK